MLGKPSAFLFLAILLASVAASPGLGWAQANQAPVPGTTVPNWSLPSLPPGPAYGSDTQAPVYTTVPTPVWGGVPYQGTGTHASTTGTIRNNWFQTCTGFDCLTEGEKKEIDELCKLGTDALNKYSVCRSVLSWTLSQNP